MTGKHESELYKITVNPEVPFSDVGHDVKLELINDDEKDEGTSSYIKDVDFAQSIIIRGECTANNFGKVEMPEAASWSPRYHPNIVDDQDQSCEILGDSKRPRKSVNLEAKLKIIRRHEAGEGANSIARAVGLAQSTVSTIIKNAYTIKTAEKFMMPQASNRIPKSRDIVMAKMERILRVWIEDHIHRHIPLSTSIIMNKARSIWKVIRNNMNPEALKGTADTFKASSGWFERFKRRANLCNINLYGKVISRTVAEPTAVKDLLTSLQEVIAKGGYTPRQVLSIDKTCLCWKNMQTHTDISQDGSVPSVKVNDDPLTLMLGSNAEGDFKMKPLCVYQWENPRSINGINKDNLPVIWRSSPNARITVPLFRSYIVHYLAKACEEYSTSNNIPNKFLLFIDNSPVHPVDMGNWASNIEVMFLPPNIKQPMGQDVISTFTAYYFHRTMEQLIQETDGETKPTIEEFWKSYNIKRGVDNIAASWADVKQSTLNEAWRVIWPACVYEFFGFDDEDRVKRYSLDLSQESGFSEAEEDEGENFASDTEPSMEEPVNFSKENLDEEEKKDFNAPLKNSLVKQLRQIRIDRSIDHKEGQDPSVPSKSLSTTQLRLFLTAISDALAIVVSNDEDSERSSGVSSKVNEAIKCYQELYENKIDKIKESIIGSTFQPIPAINGLQPFSLEVKPAQEFKEARPSPPKSSVCHHAAEQKLCLVSPKKTTVTANPDCGSKVGNEDIASTPQRNGRPVRKRKGTFITGPDFINSDEDADIDTAVRRCLCCHNDGPQGMEARKNATAAFTESFKKAKVNKKSPGKTNCSVQTEAQICKTPEREMNSHSMNSHSMNSHHISRQYNRPMVCVDRAEVNSYINIRQLERPIVLVDRAKVNIHNNKQQQYIRPAMFVDRADVSTCSNTRPLDRPMVYVDRAEVRKWCSTMNVEKSSKVELKKQDQKDKESDKSDVIKEEWELLELDRVKQEPDTFPDERCDSSIACDVQVSDVQVKQEPDENVTLVKEEYEMDNSDFVQLDQI